MIKPVASVKKLLVTLNLAPDLPVYVVGDEKRLMQILLNVVGNAVKFSKEGSISMSAFVAKVESLRDFRSPDFFPMPSDYHFYLRVQVCLQYLIEIYVLGSAHLFRYDVCYMVMVFFFNIGQRFWIRN